MSIPVGISRRSCVLSALGGLGVFSHNALAQTAGASTVSIGMVRPMSGPLKAVASGYMETVRAALEAANAQGVLPGVKLDLVVLDDVGETARTAAQAKVLAAAADVVAVLGIAGTGNVMGAAPVLQDAKLALIGPFTGTDALRGSQYRNIYHVRASYDDEIESLVQTMAARHPTGRAVVMYQDDPFGNGTYGTFLKFASGLAPQMKVSAFKFDRTSGDLADPQGVLTALKDADGVLLLAAPRAAAKLLAVARQQRSTATVYTLSVVDALGLVKDVGPAIASGVLITQVAPNPKKSTAKLAREYRQLAETARLPLSYAGMEGYIAARVLLEALRRIKAPITRDKVLSALEDFGRVDLGGFTIQYSKSARNGSKFVDLSMISPSGSIID